MCCLGFFRRFFSRRHRRHPYSDAEAENANLEQPRTVWIERYHDVPASQEEWPLAVWDASMERMYRNGELNMRNY